MRPGMQSFRFPDASRIRDCHAGAQHHSTELPSAIASQDHTPRCIILVIGNYDPRIRAEVQHPKHVARRQRRDQQFLRIIAAPITAEGRIG